MSSCSSACAVLCCVSQTCACVGSTRITHIQCADAHSPSGLAHSLSRGNIVFLQYVFLNDVPFTTEFKEAVTEAVYPTSVSFGDIPHEQWSIPSWINTTKMEEGMAYMKAKGVIYGDNLSYRHMCRYNSGFFFRHPLVMKYDYYWRIGVLHRRFLAPL